MANASPIIELIPSTGKEEGWRRFLDAKGQFLKHQLPTRHELMRIHELVTPKAGFSDVPEVGKAEFMAELIVADRPDFEKKFKQLTERLAREPYQGKEDIREMYTYICATLVDLCRADTVVQAQESFNGTLRQLGMRTIRGNGLPEIVYHSHTCVYGGDDGEPAHVYHGLSTGLREVYAALCDKRDERMRNAQTLDDQIKAEAFFQTVGTRSVHPFFDGNGRTFLAHLALTLDRLGHPVSDYQTLSRLARGLTTVTNQLLEHILDDTGVGFLGELDSMMFNLALPKRQEHMARLRHGLDHAIHTGVYNRYTNAAWWQVKRVLLREGAVKPSDYEKGLFEAEAIAFRDYPDAEERGLVLVAIPQDERQQLSIQGKVSYHIDLPGVHIDTETGQLSRGNRK